MATTSSSTPTGIGSSRRGKSFPLAKRPTQSWSSESTHTWRSTFHPEIKTSITDEDLILDLTSERLENFKHFLDQNGHEFADDKFVPYFSLPYVLSVDTDQNDDIKLIFEKQWLDDLESDLLQAIDLMCSFRVTSRRTCRRRRQQNTAARDDRLLLFETAETRRSSRRGL